MHSKMPPAASFQPNQLAESAGSNVTHTHTHSHIYSYKKYFVILQREEKKKTVDSFSKPTGYGLDGCIILCDDILAR